MSGLSPKEWKRLLIYCADHEVAQCLWCGQRFRQHELTSDSEGDRTYICCPACRTDLTESIRSHLYGCARLPVEIRQRAEEVRDAARRLVKESQQLTDRADVLMREAEAAVAALRETMQRTAQGVLG